MAGNYCKLVLNIKQYLILCSPVLKMLKKAKKYMYDRQTDQQTDRQTE